MPAIRSSSTPASPASSTATLSPPIPNFIPTPSTEISPTRLSSLSTGHRSRYSPYRHSSLPLERQTHTSDEDDEADVGEVTGTTPMMKRLQLSHISVGQNTTSRAIFHRRASSLISPLTHINPKEKAFILLPTLSPTSLRSPTTPSFPNANSERRTSVSGHKQLLLVNPDLAAHLKKGGVVCVKSVYGEKSWRLRSA